MMVWNKDYILQTPFAHIPLSGQGDACRCSIRNLWDLLFKGLSESFIVPFLLPAGLMQISVYEQPTWTISD